MNDYTHTHIPKNQITSCITNNVTLMTFPSTLLCHKIIWKYSTRSSLNSYYCSCPSYTPFILHSFFCAALACTWERFCGLVLGVLHVTTIVFFNFRPSPFLSCKINYWNKDGVNWIWMDSMCYTQWKTCTPRFKRVVQIHHHGRISCGVAWIDLLK